MTYEKFLQSCKVDSSTKRVWTKGASSRPIKSERFVITFHFFGTSTYDIERHGSRKEVESYAEVYVKSMITEPNQKPWRITITQL